MSGTLSPPLRKRRKTREAILRIGGKEVNIEGYLRPKQKDEAVPAPSQEVTSVGKRERPQRENEIDISDGPFVAARHALPIWSSKEYIQSAMKTSDVLILVGETGSGKSTQVPQFLYQEPWCKKTLQKVTGPGSREQMVNVGGLIAVTQPRRVAATTLAHRVSQERGTPLGHNKDGLVGYSVRFDTRIPRGTKIKFLTEGMLLQEMLRDPHLRQYSAIVVDEIHERSTNVDLLCGFLKQIQSGSNSGRGGIPLKVVVMSATADVEAISRFFSPDDTASIEIDEPTQQEQRQSNIVQVMKITGRQYPVDIVHTANPVPNIHDALLDLVEKINREEPLPGDILAFLPGQEEIQSAQKSIEQRAKAFPSNMPKLAVFPLYGQLSIEAQHEAFKPVKGRARKVVLATNIAETSITVPGVRYVVDCGKAKVKEYRPRLGMESLLPKMISKSSAIQRTGRAGREGPGKSFRLYTEKTYNSMRDADLPEILRTEVLSAVLIMMAHGVDDVIAFPLLNAPDTHSIGNALWELHLLGALDDGGVITEMGRKMAFFPVVPPLARVLFAAADPKSNCLLEAIDVISCLSAGQNIFLEVRDDDEGALVEELRKSLYRREGDLVTFLTTMQQYVAEHSDRTTWCKSRKVNVRVMKQALNIRKQLRQLCVREKMADSIPVDPQPFEPISPSRAEVLVKSFLKGFTLKTALLAPNNSYVTTQGKQELTIHPSSALYSGRKPEAIMFIEHVFTTKSYAKKVTAIQAVWISELLERKW
jgi:ATP-dependent RNA helicase DHR2